MLASDPVAEAIAACEEWHTVGLVRARAMLQLSYPDQAGFMFQDFGPANGTVAVLNVSTFLDRRQALEDAADRKPCRKADHEALDVLEEAGVTAMVIKSLRGHVDTLQTFVAAPRTQSDDAEAMLLDGLREIHAWLNAWSDMARAVITRRDQLIRLGDGVIAPPESGVIAKRAAPVTPMTHAPPAVDAPAAPLSGMLASLFARVDVERPLPPKREIKARVELPSSTALKADRRDELLEQRALPRRCAPSNTRCRPGGPSS